MDSSVVLNSFRMTKGNLYDDVFVKALSALNVIAITFSDNAELQQIVSTQTEKNLNCPLSILFCHPELFGEGSIWDFLPVFFLTIHFSLFTIHCILSFPRKRGIHLISVSCAFPIFHFSLSLSCRATGVASRLSFILHSPFPHSSFFILHSSLFTIHYSLYSVILNPLRVKDPSPMEFTPHFYMVRGHSRESRESIPIPFSPLRTSHLVPSYFCYTSGPIILEFFELSDSLFFPCISLFTGKYRRELCQLCQPPSPYLVSTSPKGKGDTRKRR